MAKYSFSNKAVEDLSKIWEYTFQVWTEQQADKYYLELIDYCNELTKNKNLGKNYTEINSEILGYKANHHIIFYRWLNKSQIEIVRILHSKMDLKNKIQE